MYAFYTKAGCECVAHVLQRVEIRSFFLCECSAVVPRRIYGKMRWGSSHNTSHKGREGSDPLMPMLSALGQHKSLVEAQARLSDNEHLFALFDDTSPTSRVGSLKVTLLWKRSFYASVQVIATLARGRGLCGLGLMSAQRGEGSAQFASWAEAFGGGAAFYFRPQSAFLALPLGVSFFVAPQQLHFRPPKETAFLAPPPEQLFFCPL